jgi:hypothetical protein
MTVSISSDVMIDNFSDTVGLDRAEEVLEKAARRSGIGLKNEYSRDEAIKITKVISDKFDPDQDDIGSFVQTSATTLRMQIRSGNLNA